MEELYSKLKHTLAENTRLKHRNIDLQYKVDELEYELKMRDQPRCDADERAWFTDKQLELIEENIRLKEALKARDDTTQGSQVDASRNKLDDSERRLLNEVIAENHQIMGENQRNTDTQRKVDVVAENNTILKTKLAETEAELDSYRAYCKRFMKVVTGLMGYKIELMDEKITLLSLYAFDKQDTLVFHQHDDNLQLITNDFALTWQNEIQNYLVNGRSLPAFLSCITLELFNKKTFG